MNRSNRVAPFGTAALLTFSFALMTATACSGGARSSTPAGALSPTGPFGEQTYRWPLHATITLTPDGVEPDSVIVNVGGRVTFVNNDVRPREIVSDPYLRHEDCPPLNRVGFLAPGQQRDSAVFETARTCGFHDHLDHTGLAGRVDVRIE